MPGNVPVGDASSISLGAMRVYIGAVGSTPTTDIGYLGADGLSFEITQETLDVLQGTPQARVKSFVIRKDVSISFSTIQWNLKALEGLVAGSYVTATTETAETLWLTVDPCTRESAIRLEHDLACSTGVGDAGKLYIDIFRAQPTGSVSISFGADSVHEFPNEWQALIANTDWAGGVITGGAMGRIVYKAPLP